MITLRRTAKKLRRPRPFLGLVLAVVMIGFVAAPNPLSPQALQAKAAEMSAAQKAADYAASPAAAAAVRAVFAPRKVQTSPSAPTPGLIEHDRPLGLPAPLQTPSTSFTFTQTHADGTPVAYDPCRAIHYVTRAANSPAAGPQLIQEAVAAVSRATGLVFINDGATTEAPTPRDATREAYQPERYGDRWAPVLITWATAAEEPHFADAVADLGLGGSVSRQLSGSPEVYVTGTIELNAARLGRYLSKDRADVVRSVIEHELGHVLGLAHENNQGQLMHWQTNLAVNEYQPGDLAGLAQLGQGKCEPRF